MKKEKWLTAVVANAGGEIFDLEGYAAVGADGTVLEALPVSRSMKLPFGGELMYLPDRRPLVYDLAAGQVRVLAEDPHRPGEPVFPVAAFNSPGYVITHTSAYEERPGAGYLPLFSYAAVGWMGDAFRSPLVQVDHEPRQDLRCMPLTRIRAGVKRMRRRLPGNRLRAHLEKCALTYGCPAGKNFFLQRYEAPMPTSSTCNARCLGCISLQADGRIPNSQDRIAFTPTPDEIADVALAHIEKVPRAVVSFGQGCEGDPLMVADVLVEAIRKIRSATDRGTINLNTNGSLPLKIQAMVSAGLDSLRVSMNSVRRECYTTYYRPRGYTFDDVLTGIDAALDGGAHVAVNYLNCPGFTDTPQERDAFFTFLADHPVQMIQWRNLNFDPLRYVGMMTRLLPHDTPMGMRALLKEVRGAFPRLRHGYFNPPKEKFASSP